MAASATVQWLDIRYYLNFRLDLATYGEALRAVPRLRELTIRTRSERFDGRLTPLDNHQCFVRMSCFSTYDYSLMFSVRSRTTTRSRL